MSSLKRKYDRLRRRHSPHQWIEAKAGKIITFDHSYCCRCGHVIEGRPPELIRRQRMREASWEDLERMMRRAVVMSTVACLSSK